MRLPRFLRPVPSPDLPKSFGWKFEWLALKTTDTQTLFRILNLKHIRRANWETGLDFSLLHLLLNRVFLTPPLGEWTLAVNYHLRHDQNPREQLATLSRLINGRRVCDFASHPGVTGHCWGLAENGEVIRQYGYSDGKLLYDFGSLTPDERELDFRFWHESTAGDEEDKLADANTVLALAGRWSIDPSRLAETFIEPGLGYVATQGKWIHPINPVAAAAAGNQNGIP